MTPEETAASEPVAARDKKRPFPWTCPRCLQQQVHLAVIPYRAERGRGGRLVSVEIPALRVPKCAHCGELLITYDVDDQIRLALDVAANQMAKQQPALPGRESANSQDAKESTTQSRATA